MLAPAMAVLVVLSSRGTRADLLNDALQHERPIPEIHPHGKRYLHSMEQVDALGGVIRFNYDVTVQHHVETLDEWPGLESVECRADGELIMRGSSARHIAQRLFQGSIVVGSHKWGCISEKRGTPAPFYLKVLASPVTADNKTTVQTKPTTFDACFTNMKTHMSRMPGQFEREYFPSAAHCSQMVARGRHQV